MTRHGRIASSRTLCLLALPVCLAALAWGTTRATAASRERRLAQSQAHSVESLASELEHLRTSAPAIAAGAKPQPNISGQVTDVLVEAGLAPSLLTNLTPESDAAVTSPASSLHGSSVRYRRQSARLTLEPMTMPDLGRFLKAWGNNQWTISSITITPAPQPVPRSRGGNPPRPNAEAAPDDPDQISPSRPIRVNLVIECLYVDQSPSGVSTDATTPRP